MSEAQEQSQGKAASTASEKRNCAEWITFLISSCILLALIGLILYDWLLSQQSPPVLQVKTEAVVEIREGQFYQPFVLENLAAGEKKSGYFIFTHDPREGELSVRVASYR